MQKKIGLALGAGGAKGLAHIGVLQVLLREKIPIDMIAGCSMGAIVGAAYAAGIDVDIMEKFAENMNSSLFTDVTIPRIGLMKGDKALEILRLLTHHKTFAQLEIPLKVVATDIEKGEMIVFEEGEVAIAVRASSSIPGIFRPVNIKGRLFVDGAVTVRLPVATVKEMGADFVIGVDVKTYPSESVKVNNIYDVIMRSIDILENEACKPYINMCDILINPDVRGVDTNDFSKAKECIELGRAAAEGKIEQLKEKLAINN